MTTKFKPRILDLGGRGLRSAEREACSLQISFGSIGTGTDGATGRQITSLLEDEPAVVAVQPYIVGREGETVLCVRLRLEREADRVFEELRAVARNAYLVTIRSASGREFHSPRDRK